MQQAAQAEAKGGTIVRWEKEGANYEAVIDKNGKQTGIEMDANGKQTKRHLLIEVGRVVLTAMLINGGEAHCSK